MTGINFSPTPVFYVAAGLIIGLIIGWVIGFLDSNNRSAKKIKAAESKAEAAIQDAKRKMAQAESQLPAASTPVGDDPGLLRLKNNNGRLMIEMDGAQITDSLSPEKKKRLIELVTAIRPYLENKPESKEVPQPAAPGLTPPMSAPVQQKISSTVPVAAKKLEPEINIAALSIVGQIDTVLQRRLETSPFAKSGIRLQESLQGGVEVYVGLQKYHTVDEVPDEAIKAEIRTAIAEWENKYTPR